jgi:predicted RNA methylase
VIRDLFAGPGGWDEGLRLAGRTDVVGYEVDADACATARAAGHERVRADVYGLDPRRFAGETSGLIASPPCQARRARRHAGRARSERRADLVSDRWWTEAERRAVQIECRHCHARPGAWCVTVWTYNAQRPAQRLHTVRTREAAADGRLPLNLPGQVTKP